MGESPKLSFIEDLYFHRNDLVLRNTNGHAGTQRASPSEPTVPKSLGSNWDGYHSQRRTRLEFEIITGLFATTLTIHQNARKIKETRRHEFKQASVDCEASKRTIRKETVSPQS